MPIDTVKHPEYAKRESDWRKFRKTYAGGWEFIDFYLKKFSIREQLNDFDIRKEITYAPVHAKSALIDIKNAIYSRMIDVARLGGSSSYQNAIHGRNGGVDRTGNTMDGFVNAVILPELLSMGKVGVFVDRPVIPADANLGIMNLATPYIYHFQAEDIRSWLFDSQGNLLNLLLRQTDFEIDETYGLPNTETHFFWWLVLTESGVVVTKFDKDGERLTEPTILELPMIPFVIFELNESLLTDIADYQIALLNLASSDMNYALKSNFPFYTEQYQPSAEEFIRSAQDSGAKIVTQDTSPVTEGTAARATANNQSVTQTGTTQGRRYPVGTERPSFINPSPEPLRVSMEKQRELKQEIREIVGINLAAIQAKQASAESKKQDTKTKEEGLSNIGLELAYGESQIANIWSAYENSITPITISYPKNYTLRTQAERQEEADALISQGSKVNSETLQKTMAKEAASLLVGSKVSVEDMQRIDSEIDAAEVIFIDPRVIREDHEAGFVSTELASRTRGYPEGQVDQAKKDHAERLARIVDSQGGKMDEARGINDADGEASNDEKEGKPTRGEAAV